MKKRTRLLDLYKEYHQFGDILDSSNNKVFDSELSPIVTKANSISFSFGIFNAIYDLLPEGDPLFEVFDKAYDMTIEYYTNYSGQKYICPMYEQLLELNNNDLMVVDNQIAKILLNRYKDNWTRRMLALDLEYNPIHNYDMDETRRDNIDLTEQDDGSYDVYGYNSSTESPSDKTNNTRTTKGTADKNYRSTTRKGNIGVTTSQKLLTEELEVRTYELIRSIYDDINKVIVLSVY